MCCGGGGRWEEGGAKTVRRRESDGLRLCGEACTHIAAARWWQREGPLQSADGRGRNHMWPPLYPHAHYGEARVRTGEDNVRTRHRAKQQREQSTRDRTRVKAPHASTHTATQRAHRRTHPPTRRPCCRCHPYSSHPTRAHHHPRRRMISGWSGKSRPPILG